VWIGTNAVIARSIASSTNFSAARFGQIQSAEMFADAPQRFAESGAFFADRQGTQ